jgi:hypothetical protein
MKIFKTYVDFEMEINDLNLCNDWSKLDQERFNDYQYTRECTYRVARLRNSSTSNTTKHQREQMNQVVTSQAKESMPADHNDIIEQEMSEESKKDTLEDLTIVNDNVLENRNCASDITTKKHTMLNVPDPDSTTQVESIDATPFQLEQTSMYDVPNNVITTKNNEWHGDTGKFIVHWFEHLRLNENTAEKNAHLTNDQKMMLLIAACMEN